MYDKFNFSDFFNNVAEAPSTTLKNINSALLRILDTLIRAKGEYIVLSNIKALPTII